MDKFGDDCDRLLPFITDDHQYPLRRKEGAATPDAPICRVYDVDYFRCLPRRRGITHTLMEKMVDRLEQKLCGSAVYIVEGGLRVHHQMMERLRETLLRRFKGHALDSSCVSAYKQTFTLQGSIPCSVQLVTMNRIEFDLFTVCDTSDYLLQHDVLWAWSCNMDLPIGADICHDYALPLIDLRIALDPNTLMVASDEQLQQIVIPSTEETVCMSTDSVDKSGNGRCYGDGAGDNLTRAKRYSQKLKEMRQILNGSATIKGD